MTGEIVLDVFTIKTVELYFLSSGVKTIQNVLHIFFFSVLKEASVLCLWPLSITVGVLWQLARPPLNDFNGKLLLIQHPLHTRAFQHTSRLRLLLFSSPAHFKAVAQYQNWIYRGIKQG